MAAKAAGCADMALSAAEFCAIAAATWPLTAALALALA